MQVNHKSNYIKAAFAGVLASSCFLGGYALSQRSTVPVTPPATLAATPNAGNRLPASTNFATIAEEQGPAVVNISVAGMVKTSGPAIMPQLDPNDPFYQFFRRFQPPGSRGGGETPTRGTGSGFIVKPDGVVLTNAHVVADANEVTVKLQDKREFKAKVIGLDKVSDVAVLKIDAKDLPTVKIGDPQAARVGDWVIAIGSPFGFENTVTAGIVSAKSRTLPDDGYVPFLQTDVAVNPGNSGGPLFNARGEVVGINSQIYSRSGGFQGLSFAIPIEVAGKVEQQIVATGKVSHARLGVAVQEVNQAFADSFKLPKPQGALVASVDAGGPADKAGLRVGDVILKIDQQTVASSGDLPAFVGQAAPGQKVQMEIWRQGQAETLSATLGNAADKGNKVADAQAPAGKGQLGLVLRPLDAQEARAAGVDKGLLIEDVRGPAAMAGVQSGDVLLAINGTPVQGIDQVRAAMAKAGKSVALLIERDGDKIFVPVRMG